MLFSATIRVLVSVAFLSTVIVGDPLSVVTLSYTKITTSTNEYFDPLSIETFQTKKNSQATINVPTKKELSETMAIKMMINLNNDYPIDYEIPICDALEVTGVRSILEKIGRPENFPKSCAFGPGNWTLLKGEFPTHVIPPHVPDGPFTATILIRDEGVEPYIQLDAEGKLFHAAPFSGR